MNKNFVWKFLRKTASINFSIAILLIITFFCILGSVIEQDKAFSYYSSKYPNYDLLIKLLGLDHVFRTWWFIMVLTIFIFSLLLCTFSTQLPSLKNARRWKFMYNQRPSNTNRYYLGDTYNSQYSFTNIVYSLIRLNFFVFYRNNSIYSYKGLYGRIAPIFVHFSIVIILLGSVFSSFTSFVVQEMVPRGEIFHLKNIIHAGFYSHLSSDTFFRVNDFLIDYNSSGLIDQFFSSLSVYFDNKLSLNNKTISVNKPLIFHQITLYQTDWQVDAIRVKLGISKLIQKKFIQTKISGKSCWLSTFSISDNNQVFFIVFDLDDNILVSNTSGIVLGKVHLNEKFYINTTPVILKDMIVSTGLQVKVDPGIIFVYIGFFVMILSTFVSYISYSQIWIYDALNSLECLGSTNRASLFFEQDINYLNKIYSYYLFFMFNPITKVDQILT
uniref:Cytochrome c biogenesis protein Ccs1 n=1 Tax=Polysiphonia sp. TaxID=1967842 RepID=A0A1Z1M427_9FLOR|nr:cytochrome c biogenesis protein ccs1 [Polysiphonia sp.]